MVPTGFVIDTRVRVEEYPGEDLRVNDSGENDSPGLSTSAITRTGIRTFLHRNHETPEHIRQVVPETGIRSLVIPVPEDIAILAGECRPAGFKGGIADTVILATARAGGHTVATGDPHFRALPDAVFLKTG
jgi:predicted nucleic acid-binding protein